MPFKIQRVPQGLNNALSISGGQTPIDLEDRVRGTLELVQFYALQQRRLVFANNAAIAEAGAIGMGNSAEPNVRGSWAYLFGAHMTGIKTATMTALRLSIHMQRIGANSVTLASGELGPFGATESGPTSVTFWAPYPILLVPPWDVFGRIDILGTDATINATIAAEIGVLQ